MDKKKLLTAVITGVILLGVLIVAVKLIRGAVTVVTGALNAVLGIAVVAALVVIVIWMLSYARKK